MLLADQKPPPLNPYGPLGNSDIMAAAVRMARLYYDRYPEILDWPNVHGKTALHIAALKGNEELVRVRDPVLWILFVVNLPLHYRCYAIWELIMIFPITRAIHLYTSK